MSPCGWPKFYIGESLHHSIDNVFSKFSIVRMSSPKPQKIVNIPPMMNLPIVKF